MPPHERAWRHPSEIGQAVHEPPSGRGRLLIASTTAAGLILVALLMIGMTPTSQPAQVASPGSRPASSPTTAVGIATWATLAPTLTELAPLASTTSMAPLTAISSTAVEQPATTILLAVTTIETVVSVSATVMRREHDDSIADDEEHGTETETIVESGHDDPMTAGDLLTVRLPSGTAVDVVVMATGAGGMVVVSLTAEEPSPGSTPDRPTRDPVASSVATQDPATRDTSAATDTSNMGPVGTVVAARALTDQDGRIVGLCVELEGTVAELMVIGRQRDAANGEHC